jgi:protease IV
MVLLRLIGLLFDLLLLPLRLITRRRAIPKGAYVHLVIDGQLADVVPRPRFWQVRRQKATSLHALARTVDAMTKDVRVKGIVVTVKQLSAGMAAATSLRAQLARAKAAGKEVVVHLPMGGGTKETYVASVASRVVLAPATHLAPLGFLSSSRYLKRALAKAGVEPEIYACGDYKAAGENLVRDSMSDAQREQLERMLGSFHDVLVDALAEGRGLGREKAIAIIDGAPYAGEAAITAGLADALAYEDEVPALLGLESRRALLDADDYVAFVERPLLRRLRRPPAIVVVPVHGTIAHAAGPLGSFATDERVSKMIRAARRDRRVKGVILHVDSPGGSALASDRMHHEIVQLAREKPVVACMANVAASGGYYVAAPARRIVCEPTTVTGSIGVVAARMTVDALLDKLGVTTETIRRGAHAGLLGASTRLDDDERSALRRELDATYKTFVSIVARGRNMPEDRVESLARGRVYTGADAHAAGLVDVLGGFDVALREVKALLPEALRDHVVVAAARLPRKDVPPLDPPAAAASLVASLLPRPERTLFELAARGERILALLVSFDPTC